MTTAEIGSVRATPPYHVYRPRHPAAYLVSTAACVAVGLWFWLCAFMIVTGNSRDPDAVVAAVILTLVAAAFVIAVLKCIPRRAELRFASEETRLLRVGKRKEIAIEAKRYRLKYFAINRLTYCKCVLRTTGGRKVSLCFYNEADARLFTDAVLRSPEGEPVCALD